MKESPFTETQIVLLLKVKLRTVHVGHGFEQHRITKPEDVHFEDNSCNNFLCFEEDENSDRSVQL